MVDKKIIVFVLSLVLLTGCGMKKDKNVDSYYNDYNNIAYVNEGNQIVETTTVPTTSTTKKVITTTTKKQYTSLTSELLAESRSNVNIYKDKIDLMINSINAKRAEQGLSPVAYDYELSVAASVRALEMAKTGVFEHTRPDGAKWSTVYKELGIKYNRAAENLAYGFNDIEKSMIAFMNSPTHRYNIMNPELKYVGIGVAPINNTFYFVQEYKA